MKSRNQPDPFYVYMAQTLVRIPEEGPSEKIDSRDLAAAAIAAQSHREADKPCVRPDVAAHVRRIEAIHKLQRSMPGIPVFGYTPPPCSVPNSSYYANLPGGLPPAGTPIPKPKRAISEVIAIQKRMRDQYQMRLAEQSRPIEKGEA
jgi:hypothetical protein